MRPVLTASVFLLLTACTVGPTYHAPLTPAGANGALLTMNSGAVSAAAPPDDWWRLYRDPMLDRLIGEAFAANADLKSANANLSAARAVLSAARAGLYLETDTAAGARYGRDPATDAILEIDGHRPKTQWLFDDQIDVAYELDLFGRVRRQVEAAKADAQATQAVRDDLKITVAAETARAYAEICTLGEELAVAQHSLNLASREQSIVERRLVAGAGSRFELVRAQALTAQAQAAILPIKGQRRAALLQLAAVLGRAPVNAPKAVEACVAAPSLISQLPAGDGAGLLKRRPDVRAAERRLAGASARVGVATADLYPRITLGGSYGGVTPDISALAKNAGLAWGVGPKISWAFPNQAAPRARIRQAQAGAQAALDAFDSAVLQALKETEQGLALYGAELDHRQALSEAKARASEAFELAQGQLSAGAISTLDLLIAEQTLATADAAVARSDASLVQDQIAIFKALGGGWRS